MPNATETRVIVLNNPNDPATTFQRELMTRHKVPGRTKKGLTQGEASQRITTFFEKNPAAYEAYQAERTERRKQQWRDRAGQYLTASAEKAERTGKSPATIGQIQGLMGRAFKMNDGDALKTSILSALKGGVSGPHANVLIRKADGTFVEKAVA